MKLIVPAIVVLGLIIVTALIVRQFFPSVETRTNTVVLKDSTQMRFDAVHIDSLEGVIGTLTLARMDDAIKGEGKIQKAIAFYQSIIDSLQAQGPEVTVPFTEGDQEWDTKAIVRAEWIDENGDSRMKEDSVSIWGHTRMVYRFPPVNDFSSVTTIAPISVPYPMVRIETVRTEERISWTWTAIAASVAFALGVFVVQK